MKLSARMMEAIVFLSHQQPAKLHPATAKALLKRDLIEVAPFCASQLTFWPDRRDPRWALGRNWNFRLTVTGQRRATLVRLGRKEKKR